MRVLELDLGGINLGRRYEAGVHKAEPFGEGLALITHMRGVCDDAGHVSAEIEVAVVNGQPGVRAIHARGVALTKTFLGERIPPLAQLVREVTLENTARLAVTDDGEIIGEIPVAVPMRHVRTPDGEVIGAAAVRAAGSAETLGAARDALEADLAQFTRKRHALTPVHLREVARVYREAVAAGISTQRAIQDRWPTISATTARRWVLLARKSGHLEPALGPWRAGERAESSAT